MKKGPSPVPLPPKTFILVFALAEIPREENGTLEYLKASVEQFHRGLLNYE